MFSVFPPISRTFIDTPNCVLQNRVQYSTVQFLMFSAMAIIIIIIIVFPRDIVCLRNISINTLHKGDDDGDDDDDNNKILYISVIFLLEFAGYR